MTGIINVPSTVSDPQLKVLLSQLRESTLGILTDARSLRVRVSAIEQGGAANNLVKDPNYAAIPLAPSGFTVTGLFQKIILSWAGGTTNDAQSSVSYTEIWRAATNDRDTAVLRSTSVGDVWADDVENGQGFYYWIRFVNGAGVPAPWSGGVNGGVFGQTVLNPADVIPVLSAKITTSELATALNSRINLIDAPGTGLVTQINQIASTIGGHTSSIQTLQSVTGGLDAQWSVKTQVNNLVGGIGFYNNGVTTKFFVNAAQFAVYNGSIPTAIAPFIIDSGNVYIDAAMIRDATITSAKIQSLAVESLIGDKATFVSTNIADGSITNAKIGDVIQSTDYVSGSAGWRILKTGTAEFRDIIARGDIEAQSLKAGIAMVDTLNVNGGAITAMYYGVGSNATCSSNGSTGDVVSVGIGAMPSGSTGVTVLIAWGAGGNSGDANTIADLYKNGTLIKSYSYSARQGWISAFMGTYYDSSATGSPVYSIRLRNQGVGGGTVGRNSFDYYEPALMIIGGKR